MTEQLLTQQLESPSGTGRVEPRSKTQPVSYRHQQTGCQPAHPFSLADLALGHTASGNGRPAELGRRRLGGAGVVVRASPRTQIARRFL